MKTIKISLNTDSIRAAREELREYANWVDKKSKELQKRLAEELSDKIKANLDTAWYDDLIRGESRQKPEFSVDIHLNGEFTVVVVDGQDVIWVEFGAGVYHNGEVGSKPNPYAEKHPEIKGIGTYEYGLGSRKVWPFKDEAGKWHRTKGTAAQMPIYRAVMTVKSDIELIAREVFATP